MSRDAGERARAERVDRERRRAVRREGDRGALRGRHLRRVQEHRDEVQESHTQPRDQPQGRQESEVARERAPGHHHARSAGRHGRRGDGQRRSEELARQVHQGGHRRPSDGAHPGRQDLAAQVRQVQEEQHRLQRDADAQRRRAHDHVRLLRGLRPSMEVLLETCAHRIIASFFAVAAAAVVVVVVVVVGRSGHRADRPRTNCTCGHITHNQRNKQKMARSASII